MEEQVYQIALTPSEVNIIIVALGQLPLKDVVGVYDSLRTQGKNQDLAFKQKQEANKENQEKLAVKAEQDRAELEHLRKQVEVLKQENASIETLRT